MKCQFYRVVSSCIVILFLFCSGFMTAQASGLSETERLLVDERNSAYSLLRFFLQKHEGQNPSAMAVNKSNLLIQEKLLKDSNGNHWLYKVAGDTLTVKLNAPPVNNNTDVSYDLPIPSDLLKAPQPFYGMAVFYNGIQPLWLDSESEIEYLDPPLSNKVMKQLEWIGWKSRYDAFMVSAPGATVALSEDSLHLTWPSNATVLFTLYFGTPKQIHAPGFNGNTDLTPLSYSHLWRGFAFLCHGIEWLLGKLYIVGGSNWGFAIILLAIVMKLALLPLHIMTTKLQNSANRYQAILEPKLKSIKENYRGAKADEKIMEAHRELGITLFYTLKPMLGTFFVQVPILVSIFNALGEITELRGVSFFWITDLAYPDTITTLPFTTPNFGNQVNLLPILMTLLTIISTVLFRNATATVSEVRRQKRNLYFMAAGFFILFYPFPASMVLYWTVANLLQFFHQQLAKA